MRFRDAGGLTETKESLRGFRYGVICAILRHAQRYFHSGHVHGSSAS